MILVVSEADPHAVKAIPLARRRLALTPAPFEAPALVPRDLDELRPPLASSHRAEPDQNSRATVRAVSGSASGTSKIIGLDIGDPAQTVPQTFRIRALICGSVHVRTAGAGPGRSARPARLAKPLDLLGAIVALPPGTECIPWDGPRVASSSTRLMLLATQRS
jgi:hypothetical protein